MSKLERFSETIKDLYIEKSGDKKIEELCKSLEALKDKYNKAIVILTGYLEKVNLPSGDEKIKTGFAAHMRELAAALKYKEFSAAGYHPVIIPSGGRVYGKGENVPVLADVMKEELVKKYGIKENDIIAEPYSIDTSQNARFSSKLLEALGFSESEEKSVYLVTNQFHLERATTLFNRHFSGSLEPVGAEKTLIDFTKKLPDGTSKTIYKKVIENYLKSQSSLDSMRQDKKLHTLTKLPLGEQVIEALAYYLRSSEKETEIPTMKQNKEA